MVIWISIQFLEMDALLTGLLSKQHSGSLIHLTLISFNYLQKPLITFNCHQLLSIPQLPCIQKDAKILRVALNSPAMPPDSRSGILFKSCCNCTYLPPNRTSFMDVPFWNFQHFPFLLKIYLWMLKSLD